RERLFGHLQNLVAALLELLLVRDRFGPIFGGLGALLGDLLVPLLTRLVLLGEPVGLLVELLGLPLDLLGPLPELLGLPLDLGLLGLRELLALLGVRHAARENHRRGKGAIGRCPSSHCLLLTYLSKEQCKRGASAEHRQ